MKTARIRDGAATRKKILDAAERLFSESGFAGTSIGKISKLSGISDGLILHHFRTKDGLYQLVRERIASRYGLIYETDGDTDPPAESMEGMVFHFFKSAFGFFKKNRRFHRISLWSYLEGKSDVIDNEAEITRKWADLIVAGQVEGFLENDFNPSTLLSMTMGSIHYWLRYRTQFKKTLKRTDSLAELDKQFIEETSRLLARCAAKTDGIK